MGNSSPEYKVCFVISLALMSTCSTAEREYFPQARNYSWDEARSHCQLCFKDLVTITSENTQSIAPRLVSDHWVGLRKSFNSSDPSMYWSHWANGDPLAFQNWYPGWPVLKTSYPKTCCSCSCTCPATATDVGASSPGPTFSPTTGSNSSFTPGSDGTATPGSTDTYTSGSTDMGTPGSTDMGTPGSTDMGTPGDNSTVTPRFNSTSTPGFTSMFAPGSTTAAGLLASQCVKSPLPSVVEVPENATEDDAACVAMLRFGAWVERNCTERLPFICYEDRFFGQVNVSSVTNNSATLTWRAGPGNITRYRLEVEGGREVKKNLTELSEDLNGLTAGTRHSVKVFPVKCERDLNPQEAAFYTVPNKPEDLRVTEVTETSVFLNWTRPAGNVDFYLIKVDGREIKSVSMGENLSRFLPGSPYTFSVLSVVNNSLKSEESNITAYTKPGKVSNLTVSENTNISLKLSWKPPKGHNTGYRVKAVNSSNSLLYNKTTKDTNSKVTDLLPGTMISLTVTAMAGSVEGDGVTVTSYTTPGPVSSLTLTTSHNSINATWTTPVGVGSSFSVTLQLEGANKKAYSTKEHWMNFPGLKFAAKYTVSVSIVSGSLTGPAEDRHIYTSPMPPTNARATKTGKNEITFEWDAPANSAAANYSVKLSSVFWGHSFSGSVHKETTHTFSNLNPGTKYKFEVRTVVQGMTSAPATHDSTSTVAVKREISLAMLCSSAEALRCDNSTTRDAVFEQLKAHFHDKLKDNIFWELERQ